MFDAAAEEADLEQQLSCSELAIPEADILKCVAVVISGMT